MRAETQSECMRMRQKAHKDGRNIARIMKRVRDVVVCIGSKLGLDLLGKDFMADLDGIEEALAVAEKPSPSANRPSF